MNYQNLQAIAYVILIIYMIIKMRKTSKKVMLMTIIISITSLTIFARIFWIIDNIEGFKRGILGLKDIFWMQLGGFKIIGVLIGAIVGMVISCKIFKKDSKIIINSTVEALFLAAGYTKLVCTIVGCCRGKETMLGWGLSYPEYELYNLHPTALYEMITWWIGFIILIVLKKWIKQDSTRISIGVLFYVIVRMFILEGLYEDTPFMGSTTFRIIYSTIICICLGMIFFNSYKNKKTKNNIE